MYFLSATILPVFNGEGVEEIEKSNEQFKKEEQVRMLIWTGL